MAEKKCCGNCSCWSQKPNSSLGTCRVNGATTSRSNGSSCKYWR